MPLSYVDLRFEARLAVADHGLRYLGPTLRGLFGHVFKDTVCQVRHRQCQRCLLKDACPYPAVFEGHLGGQRDVMRKYPYVPQPFVLDVAAPHTWDGEPTSMRWGLRLFGRAADWAPYVVESFMRAGVRGVGGRRSPYDVTSVTDGTSGTLLWSSGAETMVQPARCTVTASGSAPGRALRFEFITPLHLRHDGGFERELDGLSLTLAGRRRWFLLEALFGEPSPPTELPRFDASDFQTRELQVRPWRIERFSGRQQRKVELQGLVGHAVIEGPWGEAGTWLHAVPTVHLGKYTSFGLGRVAWQAA